MCQCTLYKDKQCLLARSDDAQLKSDAGGSERLQGTAGAAFYAAPCGWRQKCGQNCPDQNATRTHAIDATHNIDHLTRPALVRI